MGEAEIFALIITSVVVLGMHALREHLTREPVPVETDYPPLVPEGMRYEWEHPEQ